MTNQSYLLFNCYSFPFLVLENIYQGSMTPEAANRFNEMLMNERNYSHRRNSIEDPPQSDYEAIDTSLFGWWKAKLRKSQIRKVYFLTSYLTTKMHVVFQNMMMCS